MISLKIAQYFVTLSPQKQVVAILITLLFILGAIIPPIIVYYESRISRIEVRNDEKEKANAELIKVKDKTIDYNRNKLYDFMEKELDRRYKTEKTIDSLANKIHKSNLNNR